MKFYKTAILLVSLITFGGCATITPNFSVKPEFWNNKKQSIGIVVAKLPVTMSHKSGQQGLLDMAINNSMASDLDKHLATLNMSGINDMTKRMTEYLSKRGIDAKHIEGKIDLEKFVDFESGAEGTSSKYFANKDLRKLKEKYGVDKLLMVSVVRVGTLRSYYGFIPTSDPIGLSHISGRIINLSNNQLEWNHVASITSPVTGGDWDTPPNYPSLTKAVYTALDQSKNMLFNQFAE